MGNPLKWRNAAMIEWYGRQMALFANSNGSITSYVYNADGIHTQKIHFDENAEYAVTTKYTLDGTKIIAEDRNGSKIYYTYDDKGAIMGMIYGGVSYVFSKNLQGDVIGIYNESGNLVAKYEYNAFGKITAITNSNGVDVSANSTHIANINPFRYRGYYYDTETGFYYLQSRYYDPTVGRFLNADAFVVTPSVDIISGNMYSYCENEPVGRSDKAGYWFGFDDFLAGAAGAIGGFFSQVVSDVMTSAVTGEITISSAETYAGAIVGGATAGVASLYAGPVAGAALGSATSTAVQQTLENITGTEKRTGTEIIQNMAKDAALSAVVAKALPVEVPGVTTGRNNMSAVFASGLTKIGRGTASRMSWGVFLKGVISEIVNGINESVFFGMMNAADD